MPRYTYRGDAPVTFSQYLDVTDPEHPKTLEAHPGETYDIKQADGYDVIQPNGQFEPAELPMPPSNDWEPPADKPAAKATAAKDDKENG